MRRIVPEHVRTLRGVRPVLRAIAHPPGAHPIGCPLVPECTAVELVTDSGSCWYEVNRAWIGADLRMYVEVFLPRFEEIAAWEVAE